MRLVDTWKGTNYKYYYFDDGLILAIWFNEKTKDFPECIMLSYEWRLPITYLNLDRIIESLEYLNDNPIHEWKFDNKIIGAFITENANEIIRKIEFNDVYKDNYGYHYTWHTPEVMYSTGEEPISIEFKEPQRELDLDHWVMKMEEIHKIPLQPLDGDERLPGSVIAFRIEHK